MYGCIRGMTEPQEEEIDETIVFSASTTVISHIHKALKSIALVSGQASLTITAEGLQFSVDDGSHACQAHLFFKRDLFSTYQFNPTESNNPGEENWFVTTRLSLASLNECLHIFAGPSGNRAAADGGTAGDFPEIRATSTCRFVYKGRGSSLIVYLREGRNLSTKCQLSTFESTGSGFDELDENSIELVKEKLVQHVILKANILEGHFKELDDLKTEVVSFIGSSMGPQYFNIKSIGQNKNESTFSFPNDKSVLETFVILKDSDNADEPTALPDPGENVIVSHSYQFESIRKCRPALELADRASIRCDHNGTMSIQCMCKVSDAEGDARRSFIDFRFRARE